MGSVFQSDEVSPTEPIKPDDHNPNDWEFVSAVLYTTRYNEEKMIWYWKCCVE